MLKERAQIINNINASNTSCSNSVLSATPVVQSRSRKVSLVNMELHDSIMESFEEDSEDKENDRSRKGTWRKKQDEKVSLVYSFFTFYIRMF